MGDAAIQGRLQTLLQALALFDDEDVTKGDFKVLDRGSPPYAVILPGPFRAERAGDWSQVTYVWIHYIEVFERFLDDDYTDFTTARQAVIDQINKNPTLNGLTGVVHALADRGDDLRYLYPEGGADVPQFVFERIAVTTVEEVVYDGGGEFT